MARRGDCPWCGARDRDLETHEGYPACGQCIADAAGWDRAALVALVGFMAFLFAMAALLAWLARGE